MWHRLKTTMVTQKEIKVLLLLWDIGTHNKQFWERHSKWHLSVFTLTLSLRRGMYSHVHEYIKETKHCDVQSLSKCTSDYWNVTYDVRLKAAKWLNNLVQRIFLPYKNFERNLVFFLNLTKANSQKISLLFEKSSTIKLLNQISLLQHWTSIS